MEADLNVGGSFVDCVSAECKVCFSHCFPIPHGWFADAQKQLIGPALKGTENLLRSITAVGKAAVRRVILTSPVSAVRGAGSISKSSDGCFNEDDGNERSSPASSKTMDLYHAPSTLAEKAAWKIADDSGFELAIINPGFVIGPTRTSRTDSESIKYMHTIMNGGPLVSQTPTWSM